MFGLLAGITSSSVYNSYTSSLFSGSSEIAASSVSRQSILDASFSFDASFGEVKRSPIVSVPADAVQGVADTTVDILAEKLSGFLEPFGKSGEELKETIGSVLEVISGLLLHTSENADSISIDIDITRIQESFSASSGNSSATATVSGFALLIDVQTTSSEYDPSNSAVVGFDGSRIRFGHIDTLMGREQGVFNIQVQDEIPFRAHQEQYVEDRQHIVEFLKNTLKQIDAFSPKEEQQFRHSVADLLIGRSALNFQA